MALSAALALAGAARAQKEDACPRPPQGAKITPPEDLHSVNGVLDVSLDYRTRMDGHNRTLFCFSTPQGAESPALHVVPGDTLRIRLTNKVRDPGAMDDLVSADKDRCGARHMTLASVNLHFHGTNTAPVCHQDEVIHTLVNAGQTFLYAVHIPSDEPPGLYWYHPHVHGLENAAALGGATGPLVVEGIARYQPELKDLPRRILVFRDQPLANPPRDVRKPPPPAYDVSLNYVPVVYPRYVPGELRMRAGRQELWRVVNASADSTFNLELLYDGVPQPLGIVAFDGVPLDWPHARARGQILTRHRVFIPTAGRAEFIVSGPSEKVRSAVLITLPLNTGPLGSAEPQRPLALIRTTHDLDWLPGGSERSVAQGARRFDGLEDAGVTAHRHLYFSEDSKSNRFYITVDGQKPELYHPDEAPRITTTEGAVEDWTIENRTSEVHEFHIHQIHFLLLAIDGKSVPADQRQLSIPARSITGAARDLIRASRCGWIFAARSPANSSITAISPSMPITG